MHWSKQSTAVSYVVGPILDSTGAEYASAVIGDLSLSKNGGTLTALASAATLTYIANGQYTLALTTGNTDTLGTARILCNKSTYQMPTLALMVLPATVYDALTTNATTATGGLGDIQRMAGTALTARDIGASVLLSSGTGTGQVKLSSGYVAPDWGDVGNPTTTVGLTNTTVGTITTYTGDTPQTGDSFARIGATGSGLTSLAPSATALSTATWTGTLATNIGTTNTTVASNLDVAVSTRGTSTLTQTQVTGGAYTIQSASCVLGDARIANLDAAVSSRMATYAQPTGFLAATFPTTVASTTNITAGTITTVTNLTNLPAITANWLTAAGLATDAVTEIKAAIVTNTLTVSAGGVAQADTAQLAGDSSKATYLAAMIGDGLITADISGQVNSVGNISTNGITAASLAADAGTEIGTAVWVAATRSLTVGVTVTSMDDGVITQTVVASNALDDKTVAAIGTNGITAASLASNCITDAKIAFPSESAGRPTTFLAAMRRVWEWASNKRTRVRSTGVVSLRNDADNGNLEQQTQTEGATDTQTEGV